VSLADIAAGEKLYKSKACVGCHGKAGKKPQLENYPVLAYQNALYLEEQNKDDSRWPEVQRDVIDYVCKRSGAYR
jgi:cytochrome c553